MRRLHLVRHGAPVPDGGPAEGWQLAPDADEGLTALRDSGVLPKQARWFSSPEPKAIGTARALTTSGVGLVDGLREMTRPAERWRGAEEWGAIVRASMTELDTPALPGWETGRATQERVTGAVHRIRESCPDDEIVLAGHGTAWTLLVAKLTGNEPDFRAWQGLRCPDHCALEFSGEVATLVSAWGAWVDEGSTG